MPSFVNDWIALHTRVCSVLCIKMRLRSSVRVTFYAVCVTICPQLVMYSIWGPAGQNQGKTWQPGTRRNSLKPFITQANISTVIGDLLHDWITLLCLLFPFRCVPLILLLSPNRDNALALKCSALLFLTHTSTSPRPVFQSSVTSEIALGNFPALRLSCHHLFSWYVAQMTGWLEQRDCIQPLKS